MPDLRGVIRALSEPARQVDGFLRRSMSSIRQQAPGARMIGEFAVKLGIKEVDKRLRGDQATDDGGTTQSGDESDRG